MGKKSKRLGAELLGKGGAGVRRVTRCPLPGEGAQPTTVPFSFPTGAKPGKTQSWGLDPSSQRGTAPGHGHGGKSREGARGPPWFCMLGLSSARLAPFLPPSLALQKGRGGWQPAECGGRGGEAGVREAKPELGWSVRGREPKSPWQTHKRPFGLIPRGERGRPGTCCWGKGCERGGEGTCEIWGGFEVRHPSCLPPLRCFVCPGDGSGGKSCRRSAAA